eukprot:TRINITY_DN640_c1_g1_i6.p1 TRINITY_DN640_c1_g1~~TRINITY_DN640_c1_g1_i6.p1  ORF type:complete len:726 (+),score=189.57 TRINITY_DN640_c1_g1_i6:124-2301(+)
MAGKVDPSVLGADAAGRAPEAPTPLAYSRDELLKKYYGILRAFRARRRRAPPRLRRWRRVMLFRARRAAGKKGAAVSSGRSASGPPPGAAKHSASASAASGSAQSCQGEIPATASPCKQAARKETVFAAVRWQVSHLGERVGEAAHPGPAPCGRAGGAHLDAAQADLGGAAPQSAGAAPPLAAWTAGDVCARLEQEGLPAATISRFQGNEVSGADLLALECDDLQQHLGLTRLSERKAAWAAVLRIRESAAPAAAESPQSAPSPAPTPPLCPAAAEGEALQEAGPPAAAQLLLLPIYVDFGGETHCVEVSHLATVGELAAAVPGQGEMGVAIYFGGELLDNMTALADAGIGAEARVEARRGGVRIFAAAGFNSYGQLGVPPGEDRRRPCLSPVPADGLQPPQGAEIAELHCGQSFVLLRTAQGDVLHAGANDYGQRGEGSTDYDPHPQLSRVPLSAAAVSIAAGAAHAAAVLADRSVHTWGDNTYRQLGRGGDEAVPQAVPGISDAERVSAGHLFTFAHRRGGEVSAWGENHYGQLCLGRPSVYKTVPQRVAALCGVPLLHLTGGEEHCIALRADGRALAWGSNGYGWLADGSAVWTWERGCLPIVLQIGPQLSVAAGYKFCGSVGRDGVLRLWGKGHAQQPAAVPLPGGAAAREVVCGGGSSGFTVFARSAGGEWAAMGSGDRGLPFGSGDEVQQLRPLPEALAGCRRVVTGPDSVFTLYLCSQ